MNKKLTSLIIALMVPMMFVVGCKKAKDDFYMTEDTTAFDGSVEYSAKSYKDAFFSTENYSDEFLQKELNSIIDEISSKEDKEELIELLKAYTSTNNSDLPIIKSCFEKYNVIKQSSNNSQLESNPMYEISSRLYKATLNASKKHYDINDFYIYYKHELSNSTLTGDDLENEIRITSIKEYTISNIYKTAYSDSFISELIAVLEGKTEIETTTEEEDKTEEENKKEEVETPSTDNDDEQSEFVEFSEAVKSQIYDAGVSSAIEYLGQNSEVTPSQYAKDMFDSLENDNPLGDKKEEGYQSFLNGFKTTLSNNGIEFK